MKTLVSIMWLLLLVTATQGACFQSDVRQMCCPAACAVRNSPKWSDADKVLRACMKGIGCGESESKSATVPMRCECGKVKP